MENSIEKKPTERSLQDYLSLGYIYLLIMGIIREVIYYGCLEVNILSYSNVLDLLLSPLVFLSSNPKVIFSLLFFLVVIYFFNKSKNKKKLEDDLIPESEKVIIRNEILMGTLFLLALGIFAFFIGTGIGGGFKDAKKLKNGEFETSHQITFLPAEKLKVKLIGNNSQYIFYVLENEKHITISPIVGNMKKIIKLPSKE